MSKLPFKLKPTNGVTRETIFSKSLPPFAQAAKTEHVLKWDFTPEERHLAEQCAIRLRDLAAELGAVDQRIGSLGKVDVFACTMDLLAVHCNCMRLNLWRLLASSGDDFTHDVLGIGMTIDRTTGQLQHGFQPRCREVRS